MVVILQALAHPLRLKIVSLLCKETTSVNALAARLGVGQPIVSQQLRILRMARLVTVSRRDGLSLYRVARDTIEEMVRSVERCSESRAVAE